MKKTLFGLIVVASTMILATMAFGGPIYVKPSGIGDGSSWANAMGNLQAAIDLASTTGRSIWVASGTYNPGTTLVWKSNVKAFGGFQEGAVQLQERNFVANPSIITGPGGQRVIWMDTLTNTRIDGFTIDSGMIDGDVHWGGAGIYMNGLNNTNILVNCIIRNCVVQKNGHGGGVLSNGCTGHIIEKCTFDTNSAPHMGGGLFIHWSSATVRDCVFTNNTSGEFWHGGGMAVWESSATTITRCNFINNKSRGTTSGGGLYCGSNGNASIAQCLFQLNSAGSLGGGLFAENGNPSITDCVFLNNSAADSGGGAFVGNNNPRTLTFSRCLFQGNTTNGSGGGMGIQAWGGTTNPLSVTIGGCHFQGNTSQGDAGALDIVNPGTAVTVNGTTFVDNHAGLTSPGGQAGAIRNLEQSTLTLNRCGFFGNTTQGGGGGAVFNHVRSTLNATNCVFDNNHAPWIGGGIAVWGSTAILNHCTFNRNGNGSGNAHDLWVDNSPGAASATATNCIFWGPYGPNQVGQNTSGLLTITYSDVKNGWPGTGNINTNPLFIDGTNGNNRLQSGSPCRDTADPSSALTVDIYNNTRPGAGGSTTRRDMGAYEWNNTVPNVVSILPRSGEVNPTNTRYVVFRVTLDEGVGGVAYDFLNGFTAGHFALTTTGSISNASILYVGGNTTNREVVVDTGTGSGTIRLDLISSAGLACSGNQGLGNVPYTSGTPFVVDKANPRINSINRANANPNNGASVNFTVNFTENVSTVALSNFDLLTTGSISGASLAGLSGGGTTYTVSVNTGTGDGTLGIRMGNGADVFDSVGNMLDNWVFDSQVYTIDKTPPNPVNITGITPINNLRPTWFWTSGGGGNGTYRYDLNNSGMWTETTDTSFTPASDLVPGSNRLVVQERDDANNWSADSFFDIVIDITPPDPPLLSGTTPTSDPRPTWYWVSGGGGNGVYRYDLNNSGTWTETTATSFTPAMDLPEGFNRLTVQERDEATNWSGSSFFDIFVDITPPTIDISTPSSGITRTGPVSYLVTYADAGSGLAAITLVPANITLNATGTATANIIVGGVGSTRIVTLDSITGDGTLGISIAPGTASDQVGLTAPSAGPSVTFIVDNTPPICTLAPAVFVADPTGQTSIPMIVTFSEPVTGFTDTDIVLLNATVDNFSGSGANYTFNLLPSGLGLFSAQIPAGVAFDGALNGNLASNVFSRTFDSSDLIVSLVCAVPNPTNVAPIPVSATFNRAVTGFEASDIVVVNAVVQNFAGFGAHYTFDLAPQGQGTVSAQVSAGAATDGERSNLESNLLSRVYDSIQPTLLLNSTAPNPTNAAIPVTATFNEPVYGFTQGDITVLNATINTFTGNDGDTVYTFILIPTVAEGTISASVGAGVAADAAGNLSEAAPSDIVREYDSIPPSVMLDSASPNPTNAAVPVTVTFTEGVYGFVPGDLTVTNATIVNWSGNDGDSVYTFILSPIVGTGTVSVSLGAGKAVDVAGNPNTAAPDPIIRDYDGESPTVELTSAAPNPTDAAIPVTATFSEPVFGLDEADVIVTNATLADWVGNGGEMVYTFTLLPTVTEGQITARILANGAVDIANNGNTASNVLARDYDALPPVAICKDITAELNGTGSITVTPADVDDGSSDNVGIVTWLIDGVPSTAYSCADIGVHTVTLRVEDAVGHGDECDAEVTVADAMAPIITIPGTNPRYLVAGMVFTLPNVTANDNCDGIVPVTLINDGGIPLAPNPVGVGVYTLEWQAMDSSSNTTTASLTVIVQEATPISVTPVGDTHFVRRVGGRVTFAVEASGGATALNYQWMRVVPDKSLVIIHGADEPEYTIDPITLEDAGEYLCVVSDFATSVQSDIFTLEVIESTVPAIGMFGIALVSLVTVIASTRVVRKKK